VNLKEVFALTEGYPPIDELDELNFRSYAMFVQSKLMSSIFDLDKLAEISIDAFVELMRVDVGFIMLFNEKSQQLSVEAVKGLKRHTIRKGKVNVNKDIIQGIIKRKAPIFLSKLKETLPIKVLFQEMVEKVGGDIVLSIPLVVKKNLVGLINLGRRELERPFRQADLQFLYALADQVAIAIENANLHQEKIEEEKLRITEHKQAEEALRESEEKFRTFMETASDLMHITDKDGNFTYVNESMAKTLGYSKEEMIGMHITQVLGKEDLKKVFKPKWEELITKGKISLESTWVAKDGKEIYGEIKIVAVYDSDGKYEGARAILHDMTERKKTEEDRKKLEAQFQQAQKMESIGRLAGGIAHDFNNILTVIIGNAELLSMRLGKDNPLQGRVEEISKGGERAASLTRQILAFSRRQVLQPQVLDLNGVIPDMDKMLRRLIGEDIDLETVLAPDLGRVEADPGQIEQVIMNLAVNARDAMPTGGKLTIETANVDLDKTYAHKHVAVKPGPYVMIAISDTGKGMDEETKSYIFDPFFTTKEKSKGTGLGLSTVYGIVKQISGPGSQNYYFIPHNIGSERNV
jgi:PAS domain S-box-containing protein